MASLQSLVENNYNDSKWFPTGTATRSIPQITIFVWTGNIFWNGALDLTEVHGLPLVLDATSPTGYKGVSQRSLPPPRRFIASVALAYRGQIQLGVLSVQHGARTFISMT